MSLWHQEMFGANRYHSGMVSADVSGQTYAVVPMRMVQGDVLG